MKKISVKHFLNTSLKSDKDRGRISLVTEDKEGNRLASEDRKKVQKYPVYIKITYNRKTTQMKSEITEYFSAIEDVYTNYPGKISKEVSRMHNAITYEVEKHGEGFKLKGINQRINKYGKTITNLLYDHLSEKFTKALEDSQSEFAGLLLPFTIFKADIGILNRAALRLIDNFDELSTSFKDEIKVYEVFTALFETKDTELNVAILDWIYADYKAIAQEKFGKVMFNDTVLVKKGIDLIDNLVKKELKKE